ncbi:hypothetical protein CHI05_10020 [Bacillus sp. 7788]|uniref:hypothetical protein n=1 Tax=Bacillus sp. 7788 TaxID=2021692 RepID=UPI000BA56074|nr:hypothetical protein [Bacillus sp. 7788]PAC81738.1 hypothetical protein CHI05_10020 [Bacillus sp. 7788]
MEFPYLLKKNETSHAPKSYFNKLYTLLKLEEVVPAAATFEKGVSAAQQLDDIIYEAEMKFLYCLYFQSKTPNAITELKHWLDTLQSKNLYEDVYQLAFEAARYYNRSGQLEIAVVFYERALEAKSLIQGGELLYVEE